MSHFKFAAKIEYINQIIETTIKHEKKIEKYRKFSKFFEKQKNLTSEYIS